MDGRNPAPVDCLLFPVFIGFQPSKVVQDFFHPRYYWYVLNLSYFCPIQVLNIRNNRSAMISNWYCSSFGKCWNALEPNFLVTFRCLADANGLDVAVQHYLQWIFFPPFEVLSTPWCFPWEAEFALPVLGSFHIEPFLSLQKLSHPGAMALSKGYAQFMAVSMAKMKVWFKPWIFGASYFLANPHFTVLLLLPLPSNWSPLWSGKYVWHCWSIRSRGHSIAGAQEEN